MQLTPDVLPAYYALRNPDLDPAARAERVERWRRAAAEGAVDWGDARLLCDDQGPRAAWLLAQIGPGFGQLVGPFLRPDAHPDDPLALIEEVRAQALRRGWTRLGARPTAPKVTPSVRAGFQALGLREVGARLEFEASLSELPPEDPHTPLEWHDLSQTPLPLAAEVLKAASAGDPDGLEPDEDPREIVSGYLQELGLTRGPDCVQVGWAEGQPAAFLCAQVDPKDGWSRIAYMGLTPAFRRRGWGPHVHRHGFAMLRAQGGAVYRGGTHADNAPMLALFRRSGCRQVAHMIAFEGTVTPPPLEAPQSVR